MCLNQKGAKIFLFSASSAQPSATTAVHLSPQRALARDIAMFYSFFGTCTKNNIDPQLLLKCVMDNIQSSPAKKFKELLPQFINKELI